MTLSNFLPEAQISVSKAKPETSQRNYGFTPKPPGFGFALKAKPGGGEGRGFRIRNETETRRNRDKALRSMEGFGFRFAIRNPAFGEKVFPSDRTRSPNLSQPGGTENA